MILTGEEQEPLAACQDHISRVVKAVLAIDHEATWQHRAPTDHAVAVFPAHTWERL